MNKTKTLTLCPAAPHMLSGFLKHLVYKGHVLSPGPPALFSVPLCSPHSSHTSLLLIPPTTSSPADSLCTCSFSCLGSPGPDLHRLALSCHSDFRSRVISPKDLSGHPCQSSAIHLITTTLPCSLSSQHITGSSHCPVCLWQS